MRIKDMPKTQLNKLVEYMINRYNVNMVIFFNKLISNKTIPVRYAQDAHKLLWSELFNKKQESYDLIDNIVNGYSEDINMYLSQANLYRDKIKHCLIRDIQSKDQIKSDLLMLDEDYVCEVINDDELMVTMGPYELEGIQFGLFDVSICIESLGHFYNRDFRLTAQTPNLASEGDGDIPHPHVRGTVMCMGDGEEPITNAMRQVRLYDAFSIINSILQTYNPESPYAKLEVWNGASCYDCGEYYNPEESGVGCQRCNRSGCNYCIVSCCDTYRCNDCATNKCNRCGEYQCDQCVELCQTCETVYCGFCLKEHSC